MNMVGFRHVVAVLRAAARGFLVDLGREKWKVESGVVDGW